MLLFTIVAFLIMLTFLVVIHELGHFMTARLFKIKIEEFGIGYPPRARIMFHWKGIPFTLNWIPVGGFVRMEGEDGAESANSQFSTLNFQNKKNVFSPFYFKPRWQRLIVILAGASVNFLFGVLAFTFVYSRIGIPVPMSPLSTVITSVHEGPAKTAGLESGDKILRASVGEKNIEVKDPGVFTAWIADLPETEVELTYQRGEETRAVKLRTRTQSEIEAGMGAMGVSLAPPVSFVYYSWYRMPFESAKYGIMRSLELTKLILGALSSMMGSLISKGSIPTQIAGPIGIVSEVGKQNIFGQGALAILDFTALFSINLAIMNVLPIPALDGGRAVFILLEYLVGRKRIARIEQGANAFGMILLLGLIALVSLKDIWTILK